MTRRDPIVVDCETLGLKDFHPACEVGYWNLLTGERGVFLPRIDAVDLASADPEALRVNQYYERGLHLQPQDLSGTQAAIFHNVMHKNILLGSNPSFDAAKCNLMFQRCGLPPGSWHYRFIDLGNMAIGALGLGLVIPPGLARVAQLLDVPPGDHSAEADVTCTGLCFLKLQQIAQSRKAA